MSSSERLSSKTIYPKERIPYELKEPIIPQKRYFYSTNDYPALGQTKKKRKMLSFENYEEDNAVESKVKISSRPTLKKPAPKTMSLEYQLKEEYARETERMKEYLIYFEFTYWEGFSVVKSIRRKKKETIKYVLEMCRLELIDNFQNLVSVDASYLLLVIKDFIVPHNMAIFYIEMLGLKTARQDALLNLRNVNIKKDGRELVLSVNLDEPFRIIEKEKYEKNKTIFPFVNWHTLNLKR